jgi:hypothetical protein
LRPFGFDDGGGDPCRLHPGKLPHFLYIQILKPEAPSAFVGVPSLLSRRGCVGCCCGRWGSAGHVGRGGGGRTRRGQGASGELDDNRASGGRGEAVLIGGDVVDAVCCHDACVDLDRIRRGTVDECPDIEIEVGRRTKLVIVAPRSL